MIERVTAMMKKQLNTEVMVRFDPKDEVVAILVEEFNKLNELYFEPKLKMPIIEFSSRKTYGGYYQKSRHRIVLSWQANVEHGLDETLNTFRHEVAHIVHQNHQIEFWRLASQLGVTRKYAATPLAAVRRRTRWYAYQCPACSGLVQRRRRIRTNSSCSKCDTKYNPAYRLTLLSYEVR